MPSNHLILYRPLLLLPSIFPSIRVFSNESVLPIKWPNYWGFSFSISLSNEYSGLISFKIDWFDLLAVQGTLKSFPQHHNSKASTLWHSIFFIVQLSHPYMTTGKNHSFDYTKICQQSDMKWAKKKERNLTVTLKDPSLPWLYFCSLWDLAYWSVHGDVWHWR